MCWTLAPQQQKLFEVKNNKYTADGDGSSRLIPEMRLDDHINEILKGHATRDAQATPNTNPYDCWYNLFMTINPKQQKILVYYENIYISHFKQCVCRHDYTTSLKTSKIAEK